MFFRSCLLLLISSLGLWGSDSTQSIIPEPATAEWTKSWWMPRHEHKLEEKERMGRVDLVFIGDSITHLWEKKASDVWKQYYGERRALNLGFSGDRTEHVLWRLDHGEIDGIRPKLIVLMIGTNNTGHRQDKAEWTALGIRKILDSIQAKQPQAKVLLLAIFPRGAQPNDPMRVLNEKINTLIQGFADDRSVFFLNINEIFLNEDGVLSEDVMDDLLHPNAEQYSRWAQEIEPEVKTLLGE